MAQARRRRTRQVGAGNGLPGWAMLTIGLIIGLFVAFLVYLDDLQEPPAAAVQSSGDGPGSGQAVTGEAPEAGDEAPDKPRFEFYSILPELEVVVPDQAQEAAPEDTDEGVPEGAPEPPPEPEGTFYLQAGSFQESDQADSMKARIALLGLNVTIQSVTVNDQRWHRVRVGPYDDRESLSSAQQRLRENDIDFLVLREKSSG